MEQAVIDQEIPFLCHFTRVCNLRSIFRRGILPREIAEERIHNLIVNDEDRHDRQTDANCLSISFPNYKMFYSLRMDDQRVEWAVITIKRDLLWSGDCAFCTENAASNNVTCIPLRQRMGRDAFLKLFADIPRRIPREDLNLPIYYPTNPQAEVLYFGSIRPSDILSVHFEYPYVLSRERERLERMRPEIQLTAFTDLFDGRRDYEEWR